MADKHSKLWHRIENSRAIKKMTAWALWEKRYKCPKCSILCQYSTKQKGWVCKKHGIFIPQEAKRVMRQYKITKGGIHPF